MVLSPAAQRGFCPYWSSSFSPLRHQLGLLEYRKLDLPCRGADVVQAIGRGEKQLRGLLPRMPRLSVLW